MNMLSVVPGYMHLHLLYTDDCIKPPLAAVVQNVGYKPET